MFLEPLFERGWNLLLLLGWFLVLVAPMRHTWACLGGCPPARGELTPSSRWTVNSLNPLPSTQPTTSSPVPFHFQARRRRTVLLPCLPYSVVSMFVPNSQGLSLNLVNQSVKLSSRNVFINFLFSSAKQRRTVKVMKSHSTYWPTNEPAIIS